MLKKFAVLLLVDIVDAFKDDSVGVVCLQLQRSDELCFKVEIHGEDQVLVHIKLGRPNNLVLKWIILHNHI